MAAGRVWRWFYRKVRATIVGGAAAGTLGAVVIELVEEWNGEATLSAFQQSTILQFVTLVGGVLAATRVTEDHAPSDRQLAALSSTSASELAGEPRPTPPGPERGAGAD